MGTKDSAQGQGKKLGNDFRFVAPKNVPVFEPSIEEFEDPLAYIKTIRPLAEQTGICKIKPPQNWQPPFTVDIDNFKFTPRKQRLNELEANTRIKLNFLDQIAKYWDLQGSALKIPKIQNKPLDLYTLYKLVKELGGAETITKEKKWTLIAQKIGLSPDKDLENVLKNHFEKILLPYDVFQQNNCTDKIKVHVEKELNDVKSIQNYKPHGIVSRQAIKPPQEKYCRRSQLEIRTSTFGDGKPKACRSKELQRLQFYGAGPKMAGYQYLNEEDMKNKTRGKKVNYQFDPLAKYTCQTCGGDDMEKRMLPCDTCDHYYHMFCLVPPMQELPKDFWSCPKCVAKEVSRPMEAFGFEQAERDYTLQEFGEKADKFKADYFSTQGCRVPLDVVEREFWRILSSIDEDVTVEYGADLHTMDHGSGFPTKFTPNLHPVDAVYAHSGWNLNNIPVLEDSVLGHISADISGMKVPWMYVGMCFAAFCWHNEDHWSYSINYLHWGEPKTWYGVPGSQAEKFEAAMKKAAPELFDSQPDLLHQLVTIMNPNTLMKEGVPIFRTDQHAGEFVLTFPRAYHAGFNQGFNFAEAVNFAPADWLSVGRECVEHYSALQRFCVFSHDELVCIMAQKPEDLNKAMATATYRDVLQMFKNEQKLRKSVLEWGVKKTELEFFEQFPDDARQCDVCKTTCFLSAVSCECTCDKLVCLRHYTSLCECPPFNHVLKYRYTMHELAELVRRLRKGAEAFDIWLADVRYALDPGSGKKKELQELKQLLQEAEEKKFPHSELLERISQIVEHGEKCAKVAEFLQKRRSKCGKAKSANDLSVAEKHALTLEDLTLFNSEIELSPCHIKECDEVGKLLYDVKIFQNEASDILQQNVQEASTIEQLVEKGVSLDVKIPELSTLMDVLNRMKFLAIVTALQENTKQLSIEEMQHQLRISSALVSDNAVSEALPELQKILQQAEAWQAKAKAYVEENTKMEMSTIEALLMEADSIPALLPFKMYLQEIVEKASEWSRQAEVLKAKQYLPIEPLEECVMQGRIIPVCLELLAELELKLRNAENWKSRAACAFLRKRSIYSLAEVLIPNCSLNQQKKGVEEQHNPIVVGGIKWMGDVDQKLMAAAYREAAEAEKVAAYHIQLSNLQKVSGSDITTYCVCTGAASENMLQCDLCKDLFHFTCLSISKKTDTVVDQDQIFFCPTCLRSRRPPLMVIFSLVLSLYKLDVRMPEGEALLYLAERALKWVERARQTLSREEIKSFIEKLSPVVQERIKAELEAHSKVAKLAHGLFQMNDPYTEYENQILGEKSSNEENTPNLEENNNCGDVSFSSLSTMSEDPVFLTKEVQAELEELFISGSLIQASLSELKCIWRILKITNPKPVMPKIAHIMDNEKIGKRKQETEEDSEPIGKRLRPQRERQSIKIVDVQGAVQNTDGKSVNEDVFHSDGPKNSQEVSNEEEEECGAPKCLKPIGDQLDWVQCDGICEKWFHFKCVGISIDDISKEKEYVCCQCMPSQAAKVVEVAVEPEIIIIE